MHMLHLLRHAKSSWKEEVEDHERRLNRRGREAARRVGQQLPAAIGAPDLVLCSSARRTRETIDLVIAGFASAPPSVSRTSFTWPAERRTAGPSSRLAEETATSC